MPSLKEGICPQCGSERVRSGAAIEGKEGLRGGNRIPINAVIYVALDNYVCVDCGYVESYISDRSILNRIAKEWARVEPKDSD
jgi:hypothetical protein